MENLKGLSISDLIKSKRIIVIEIKEKKLKEIIKIFKKIDISSLELKPFSRFNIAKKLENLFEGKLSNFLNKIIKNRKTGCFILSVANVNKKITNDFLIKLSTAIGHLLGVPNHDAMSGKYYARFHVKHEDNSDSYLRKAYKNMDLHTDGTYVDEKTDWLIMSKLEEKNAEGGETSVLHLDDLENLDELLKDPVGKEDFLWGSPKSKNIDYKVKHPIFTEDENGMPSISYIDQFPEPQSMNQGNFLQKLSDSLEESSNKIITELPVGSMIVANNHFWLHGRKPFKENKSLCRELLRIRGKFN
mgnify:CR=1 FL=1